MNGLDTNTMILGVIIGFGLWVFISSADLDLPTIVVAVLNLAVRLVFWVLRWHPWLTLLTTLTVLAALKFGPLGVIVLWDLLGFVGFLWWNEAPASFECHIRARIRSAWRTEWVYRRRWRKTMTLSGLSARVESTASALDPTSDRQRDLVVEQPDLIWVRSERAVDRVLVRHRLGHETGHLELRADAFAQSFRAQSCQIRRSRPGYAWMYLRYRETLANVVAPLGGVPLDQLDLNAVPVGITDTGEPWTIPIAGNRILIGGAPGSGKSELIWATLDALGPAIAAGIVEVWAVDPKGGMELAAGAPMFRRFAYPELINGQITEDSAAGMVNLLTDAANLVIRRGDAMRGIARKHTPSRNNPAVLLIVDELGFFTKYLPVQRLRKQAALALGVLTSQGRGPGVSILGAIQDVRKDAIPDRDLFDTRIGLRLPEASQSDLILGDGAHKRGATCDLIPRSLPGVGYVMSDQGHEPIRIRGAHLDDSYTHQLAAIYPCPPLLASIKPDEDEAVAA